MIRAAVSRQRQILPTQFDSAAATRYSRAYPRQQPPVPPTTTRAPLTTPTTRTSSTPASMAPTARATTPSCATPTTTKSSSPVTPFPEGSGVLPATAVLGTGNVQGHTQRARASRPSSTKRIPSRRVSPTMFAWATRAALTTRMASTAGQYSFRRARHPGHSHQCRVFNNALPLFTFTGFQQLGSAASTFSQYQTGVYELVDTASWVHGAHSIKFGLATSAGTS